MIKIKNIMTENVVTISPSSSITEAADRILSKEVSSLVVVEKNKPIAIISRNDIIKGLVAKKTKVKDVMDMEFMVMPPLTNFSEIIKYSRNKKIRKFPIVDNGILVGLVTETDIVEATRDFTRFHQIMQEVILAIFGLATSFFLFYFSPLGASIFG